MTGKDPTDMTASELLRWVAHDRKFPVAEFIEARTGKEYCETSSAEDREAFRSFADKIDLELIEARADGLSEGITASLRTGAELWAKDNGWPDFREGEDFGSWLDRCAIPRPHFEDGEPVQFGDEAIVRDDLGEVYKMVFGENGCAEVVIGFEYDSSATHYMCVDGNLVKRPAPEVLGADGKPIVVGETVYRLSDGAAWEVTKLHHSKPRISVVSVGGKGVTAGGWFLASEYTHTPPDTSKKIKEDTGKSWQEYWGCNASDMCETCTRMSNTKPSEYYGTFNCSVAQGMDIARRQYVLDKRTGGAE